MVRAAGIAILVVAVFTAVEVYSRGVDGAFGGVFLRLRAASTSLDAPAERATPDRTADAFQRAYNRSEARVEEILEPPEPSGRFPRSRPGASPP